MKRSWRFVVPALAAVLVSASMTHAAPVSTAKPVSADTVVPDETGRTIVPDNGLYSLEVFDGRRESMTWTTQTGAATAIGAQTAENGCAVSWSASLATNSVTITASNIRCWGRATMQSLTVRHLDANVWSDVYPTRFPWNERRVETKNCTFWNNNCVGQTFTFTGHRIYRTSYVKAVTSFTDSLGHVDTQTSPVYTYNNNGRPYPNVRDTRYSDGRFVAFRKPLYGWGRCEEEPTRLAPCTRSSTFRQRTINWYNANGRPLPSAECEAHHQTPIEFYGGNAVPSNAVALATTQHQILTTWFASFSLAQW